MTFVHLCELPHCFQNYTGSRTEVRCGRELPKKGSMACYRCGFRDKRFDLIGGFYGLKNEVKEDETSTDRELSAGPFDAVFCN